MPYHYNITISPETPVKKIIKKITAIEGAAVVNVLESINVVAVTLEKKLLAGVIKKIEGVVAVEPDSTAGVL